MKVELARLHRLADASLADREDGVEHDRLVLQHVRMPESRYGPTLRIHEPVARRIVRAADMLAAVDLDDEAGVAAGKVREIGAKRKLTHEFVAVQLPVAQTEPQKLLGGVIRFA